MVREAPRERTVSTGRSRRGFLKRASLAVTTGGVLVGGSGSASASTTVPITGTLQRYDGRPVPNASLHVNYHSWGHGPSGNASGDTDADGAFEVTVPGEADSFSMGLYKSDENHFVSPRFDGVPHVFNFGTRWLDADGYEFGTVRLPEAARVDLRAVIANGAGVEDARPEFRAVADSSWYAIGPWALTTNDEGYATLEHADRTGLELAETVEAVVEPPEDDPRFDDAVHKRDLQVTAETTVEVDVSRRATRGSQGEPNQPSNVRWEQTFGGTGKDWTVSVASTENGYVFVGGTRSFGGSDHDIWLVKTDNRGRQQWREIFGGDREDVALSVIDTADGVVFVGQTNSLGDGGYGDLLVVKTDLDGREQWIQTFGEDDRDRGRAIVETADGYVIAGGTSSYGPWWEEDMWLIKIDRRGHKQWSRRFGGDGDELARSLARTRDGGFVLAGRTTSSGAGSADAWLVKTDSKGDKQWDRTFGGSEFDRAHSVIQTTDGGYLFAGLTTSMGAGRADAWLVKTDGRGRRQWSRTFGKESGDWASSVIETDGGYLFAGGTRPADGGRSNALLLKTDERGTETWRRTFGGSGGDYAGSVIADKGGYVFAGGNRSYGPGGEDAWLVKTRK